MRGSGSEEGAVMQLGTHLLHVADSLLHPRFESLHAAALIFNSLLRRGDDLQ
jgi:hypothetical protein